MTYLERARRYEAAVLSGEIDVCRWVRLACDRNRRDTARAQAGWVYRFSEEAAERVCEFVEQMPHILGDFGKPTVDEDGSLVYPTIRLEDWQIWILSTVFGWVRVSDGKRRTRIALILVPRKNAKSTLLAAVANYMLTADGEVGAKCYSAATTRDQAKIVAETAYQMAARLPKYRDWCGVKLGGKSKWTFGVPSTASTMEPLSADANTLDGLNVHFAAVDEMHAHKTRHVWDVLDTATGARSQPLLFPISTAGVETGGICYELLTYGQKILDRAIDDETFFAINYTVDEGDDPFAEATHRKANPNYGVSVQPDDLERKAQKARASSAALNNFLTKHLNVWVRSAASWAPMPEWVANGDPTLRPESFPGAPCWIGIDLAEVRDIAAAVLIVETDHGEYAVFGRYYMPAAAVAKSPVAQLSGWALDKAIIETPGDIANYQQIEDDIADWCQRFRVQGVYFDRALAAQMMQQLQKRLGDRPPIIIVPQQVQVMNPAMQTVERLILSGKLKHDGNPCLTWMMANVVVERNHKDEIFPRKAGGKDSPNKIDGPVALFTAMSQVAVPVESSAPQVFILGGARA